MKRLSIFILSIFMLAGVFIIGGVNPAKVVKAATSYVRSEFGKSKTCGAYPVQL